MNECTNRQRLQFYLDGDLGPDEATALELHLESCAACQAELAAYSRLFEALRPVPVRDPGPALTERVLDRVLPSRLRRRWIAAVGWSYTAASATCTFMFASWISRPETHVWIAQQFSVAAERLVRVGWMTLDATVFVWGWLMVFGHLFGNLLARFAPVARALALPFAQPLIGAAVWAAVVSCGVLLWWLRSRGEPAAREVRHVDIVGF
jgi:anti-sigma factor RsiW